MPPTVNPPGGTDTLVRPPLTYPGNKAELAETIISHMPQHDRYVSVFGGTAGVLFNKTPSSNEIYNDANEDLTRFMRTLRDHPDELMSWLRHTPYSEAEYERVKQAWRAGKRPDDDVVRAGQLFLLRRASYGADITGFKAFASGRKNSAKHFENARQRLNSLSDRLNEVIIRNMDWTEIIQEYASPDTFFYCDPPYHQKAHYYSDIEYDRGRFIGYWLAHFDGASNEYNRDIYLGPDASEPPEFTAMSSFTDDGATYRYGTDQQPFQVMISSLGRITGFDPYTWTVQLDATHEINNEDGATSVQETLTMNYDPWSDDFKQFATSTQLADYQ